MNIISSVFQTNCRPNKVAHRLHNNKRYVEQTKQNNRMATQPEMQTATMPSLMTEAVVVLLLLMGATFISPARAAPITEPAQLGPSLTLIDFNSLTNASISGPSLVISGVTFTGFDQLINVDNFAAATNFPDYVSGLALGRPDTNPNVPPNDAFTVTFNTTVAQVGFGLFDPNFEGNVINAYDSAGTILESTQPDALFPPGGSGADYVGFVRGSADIKSIEVIAARSDALWIDNLAFAVPLPAAVWLFGSGLIGLIGFTRRKKPKHDSCFDYVNHTSQ